MTASIAVPATSQTHPTESGLPAPNTSSDGGPYPPAEGAIFVANLDGSGSPRNMDGRTGAEDNPRGVAIDRAGGKIYWSDYSSGLIRVGSITGSFSPHTLFRGEAAPNGVSLVSDLAPEFSRIYWADTRSGQIRVGHLDGSGSARNLYSRGSEKGVVGVTAVPNGSVLYLTPRSGLANYSAISEGDLVGNCCPAALGPKYELEPGAQYVAALLDFGIGKPSAKITKAIISRRHHSAKFTFKTTGQASSFQCALIKAPTGRHAKVQLPNYRSCRSPKSYKHLRPGTYRFFVRTFRAGVAGVAASESFKISKSARCRR